MTVLDLHSVFSAMEIGSLKIGDCDFMGAVKYPSQIQNSPGVSVCVLQHFLMESLSGRVNVDVDGVFGRGTAEACEEVFGQDFWGELGGTSKDDSSGTVSGNVFLENTEHFYQLDEKWGDEKLPGGDKMEDSGCLVCCWTTILSYLLKIQGEVNPLTIRDWLKSNEGFQGNILVPSGITSILSADNKEFRYKTVRQRPPNDPSLFATIKEKIDSGMPVILGCRKYGDTKSLKSNHFVVCAGYKESENWPAGIIPYWHDPATRFGSMEDTRDVAKNNLMKSHNQLIVVRVDYLVEV